MERTRLSLFIFAIVFFGVLTGATYLWERGRGSTALGAAPNNS